MQIIDSIETYAYKTNADVKKMKLNVTKKKKKALMTLQKKK